MKLLMLIGSILIIQLTNSQNDQPLTTSSSQIKGMVWLGKSYCKGTESDNYLTDNPMPNQKFYMYSGGIQDSFKILIQTFYSDNQGRFSLTIDEGLYTITTEPLLNQTIYCADYFTSNIIWTQGPIYEFEANSLNKEIIFSFYIPCPPGPREDVKL